MKRQQCIKNEEGKTLMTTQNIKICLKNQQEAFDTLELNESLHLQYYGFANIDNLEPFTRLHTLFLNNNAICEISHLEGLAHLITLNLSYNCIREIKNLKHLTQLYSLDLSHNHIQEILEGELDELQNLNNLKLGHNLFKTYEGIKGIKALNSLSYLDLSSNETLDYDHRIYEDLFSQSKITVLSLTGTLIPKNVPSYRKQTIITIPSLKFLDDRPVTEDERMLAQAWKKGGLILEKEVRSKLRQKLIDKNNKIYAEIEERNKIVEDKRKRVFQKLTIKQIKKLNELYQKKKGEDYELILEAQKSLLDFQIQELQKYLESMKENVKSLDLQKELNEGKVDLPTMLIEKQTPEAIFLYNVSQEQLPLVIEKYYPYETRLIIAAKQPSSSQTRWIKEYDELLHSTFDQVRGDLNLLVPAFNLGLYELDATLQRKIKRFELEELKHHLGAIREEEERRQRNIDVLNELD